MRAARRLILVTALLASTELATAAGSILATGPQRITLFLLVCGLATAGLAVVLRALLRPHGPAGGDGGSARPAPEPPEPSWWPEFEARFRDHAARAGERTPASR